MPPARLGRTVIALGVVSFLTDASSEMIYPLLPVFLTATLGASATALGTIEGAAESTAALLKLASGWWSDRVRRRKPLVVFGYTLSSLARPLVALAQSSAQVLVIRLADRVGKGVRGAPRDALIADSVDPAIRGRAFGFHRAADHAGAVVGPLAAFVLLQGAGLDMRTVFLLAAIPAAAAVVAVVFFVREPAPLLPAPRREAGSHALNAPLPRSFWYYLVILGVFTLGNATDAFLLLRAQQLGVPLALLPILWASLHVVKSATSTAGGALSDRVGRLPSLVGGWAVFAMVYLGFGVATQQWHAWALFLAYGLYFALTEGPERALVADLVPAERRGTAFGWFNLTIGLGALPASVIFGVLWDSAGPRAAFGLGAALALIAALALAPLARRRQQQR
ncbi:MAG TPA: MFS transporter [Gemmatimonadaceae bacterium]|nr:MFS transporter [Gemmatimonadaceae bacterium]